MRTFASVQASALAWQETASETVALASALAFAALLGLEGLPRIPAAAVQLAVATQLCLDAEVAAIEAVVAVAGLVVWVV